MWRAMCTDACRKRITCTITRVTVFYLNNRVFLSRNYRLIVAPRKFDVLKRGAIVFIRGGPLFKQ